MDPEPRTAGPRERSSWHEVRRLPTERAFRDASLVLTAVDIPWASGRDGAERLLLVPASQVERAEVELARFDQENAGWPPEEEDVPLLAPGMPAAVLLAGLLVTFFILDRTNGWGLDWYGVGYGDAGLVLEGAWWRAITSLALHADVTHLAGNVVFGGLFLAASSQAVGAGTAWLSTLLAGFLGNVANAIVQGPDHRSIGASTAVFGAIGILAAFTFMTRRRRSLKTWKRWTPPIVALIFLAFLGLRGERTDVFAHVTGLLCGAALGLLLGRAGLARLRRKRAQRIEAAVAAGLFATAWTLAFLR